MPLPKINSKSYTLTLYSKKTLKYRPFLVREEKLLAEALDSSDTKKITQAIKSAISNCILDKGVNIESLPIFDLELLFLKIRSHSVDKIATIQIVAPDDGKTVVDVNVDLSLVEVVEEDGHSKQIKLDDDLMMEMKYPSLSQFVKLNFNDEVDQMSYKDSLQLIASCVDKIYTEDEVWTAADVSNKELLEFLEQMSPKQFKEIEKFFATMPKLSHEVIVKNPNTDVESPVKLVGLASFFS